MKLMRLLLGLLGLAAVSFGVAALAPSLDNRLLPLLGWLLAGPILHDVVFATLVIGVATLLRTLLPAAFHGPIATALLLSLELAALATPLLWRPNDGPTNPGLHDRHLLPGLAVALAVMWCATILVSTVRHLRGRHSQSAG